MDCCRYYVFGYFRLYFVGLMISLNDPLLNLKKSYLIGEISARGGIRTLEPLRDRISSLGVLSPAPLASSATLAYLCESALCIKSVTLKLLICATA